MLGGNCCPISVTPFPSFSFRLVQLRDSEHDEKEGAFYMVKMPCFETSCLETGIKTLVTETGQQLPPSYLSLESVHKYNKNTIQIKSPFH